MKLSIAEAGALKKGDVIEAPSLMPSMAPDEPTQWVLKVKTERDEGFILDFDILWCDSLLRRAMVVVTK